MNPKTEQLIETLLADPNGEADNTNLEALKAATIAYFTEGKWGQEDLQGLANASSIEMLEEELYPIASQVGERKGYGEEGVSSLLTRFQKEIATRAGLPVEAWEY